MEVLKPKTVDFDGEFNMFASNKDLPVSQTLSAINTLKESCNDAARDMALKYFRIGVLINTKQTELTHKELAGATGIQKSLLTESRIMAEKYDNNELHFLKDFNSYPKETKAWGSFYIWAVGEDKMKKIRTKKKGSKRLRRMANETNRILEAYKDDPEEFPSLVKEAAIIRNILSRYFPETEQVIDQDYIKYNECCCCGAYPPPEEGYKVKFAKKTPYLKYPVCDKCLEMKKRPNYKLIAELYGRYAVNIENAFDKLREML